MNKHYHTIENLFIENCTFADYNLLDHIVSSFSNLRWFSLASKFSPRCPDRTPKDIGAWLAMFRSRETLLSLEISDRYAEHHLWEGEIPDNIFMNFPNLTRLKLCLSFVGGTFPTSIPQLSQLNDLTLDTPFDYSTLTGDSLAALLNTVTRLESPNAQFWDRVLQLCKNVPDEVRANPSQQLWNWLRAQRQNDNDETIIIGGSARRRRRRQ